MSGATQVTQAGHIGPNGLPEESFRWFGLWGGNPYDWANPSRMDDPAHIGSVRYGIKDENYHAGSLTGKGKKFWNFIMEYVVTRHPNLIEEVWFGPQFHGLGRMIRIRLTDGSKWDKVMPSIEQAVREAFGEDAVLEDAPHPLR